LRGDGRDEHGRGGGDRRANGELNEAAAWTLLLGRKAGTAAGIGASAVALIAHGRHGESAPVGQT
jgi:hypothetical protein